MFHNVLVPTDLPSSSKSRNQKVQQSQIEKAVINAINDFVNTNRTFDSAYNIVHPNTIALIKSMDKFFAHGLVKMDKCYWPFTREFIPAEERLELKRKWNCYNRRDLSLAWIKDSLNRGNLQFQMFGFIASNEELKIYYERNACIRNKILLKRICLLLDDIAEIQFNIEPPFVFRTEDTPIALPISQMDGTMSPIDSINSSLNGSQIQFSSNLPMNIHRKRERQFRSSLGSFAKNSYLEKLVDDLPEVNLTALTNTELIVQSDKEQTYILDEMLKTKRKGLANSSAQFFPDDEEESMGNEGNIIKEDPQSSNSIRSLIPEDPCTSGNRQENDTNELGKYLITDHSKQLSNIQTAELSNKHLNKFDRPASITSLSNNSELLRRGSSSREDDELSVMDENEVLIEGEVFLDSGEIIQLQIELCLKEDGERIHRLFQVFTGHSTGLPLIRYLLITDYYIYLLAGIGLSNEEQLEENEKIENAEELAAEAFERNLMRMNNGPPKKFRILIVLPLCDIDHLAIGPDAQVLCFQSKRKKFQIHPQSGHEQRTFLVETCSRVLGKTVAFAVQKAVANRALAASSSNSGVADDEQQNIAPLIMTTSHSSQLGIVIKRFIRKELGIQNPEIVHHSLIYWQQNAPRQQKKQLESEFMLECYLYVREHYQRGWTRRRGVGEWQQNYVVLRGLMIYQFFDSSFKFALRSLNLRNSVEEIGQLETNSDGKYKYTFKLIFSKDVGFEGLSALELSCQNEEVANQWISSLSLAFSLSNEAPLPVACMAIITETHILFAQEGMNCFIDGFMRSICSFHIHESAEIFVIRTDLNNVLLIRRDNGLDEWLTFRERLELERMVECLRQRWQLPVIDFGENAEQLLKLEFNQLFMDCARMPDLWRTEPRNSFN